MWNYFHQETSIKFQADKLSLFLCRIIRDEWKKKSDGDASHAALGLDTNPPCSVCPHVFRLHICLSFLLLHSVFMKNNTLQDMRTADVWGNKLLIVLELAFLCAWLNCDVCIFTVSLQNTCLCLQGNSWRRETRTSRRSRSRRSIQKVQPTTSQDQDPHSSHYQITQRFKVSSKAAAGISGIFSSGFLDLNGWSDVFWSRHTVLTWMTLTAIHAPVPVCHRMQTNHSSHGLLSPTNPPVCRRQSNKSSNFYARSSHMTKVSLWSLKCGFLKEVCHMTTWCLLRSCWSRHW